MIRETLEASLLLLLALGTVASPVQGQGSGSGLDACPSSPNCVGSLDPDPERRVEPLPADGPVQDVMDRVEKLVRAQTRATVAERQGPRLRAEFRSRVLGFVDDVEFLYLPDERAVHLRSASRTGWWDMGVNRRRARSLRMQWQAD